MQFSLPDIAAFAFFVISWGVYHVALARGWAGEPGLNRSMDEYRRNWMEEMSARESRIVDSAVMASVQNGTAFFASTSLLAIGGGAALLRSSDDVLKIFSEIAPGLAPGRGLFEIKVVGLLVILGYAFFKFAWSYRLFNFSAMLIGATPSARSPDHEARSRMAARAARMSIVAGNHFSRGQRGFFFALAWLGWFLGPWVFLSTTGSIVAVMWMRQFNSDALAALKANPADWVARDKTP